MAKLVTKTDSFTWQSLFLNIWVSENPFYTVLNFPSILFHSIQKKKKTLDEKYLFEKQT